MIVWSGATFILRWPYLLLVMNLVAKFHLNLFRTFLIESWRCEMDFILSFSPTLCFCYEMKFKRKTKHCVFCTGTINSEKTKPATPGICIVQAQPFYPINQPGISLNLFTDNKSQKLILLFNFVNTSSNVHLP